jgi:tripartite-type tricarboxylate transporter receptor subunit TctC
VLSRRTALSAAGALALSLVLVPAAGKAQAYPERPIRIVVGASPGGGADTTARMVVDWLSRHFGSPFVVENKPGASNTIGAEAVARSRPDGYTLFLGSNTPMSIAPHLLDLRYDTLKDLAPVALVSLVPNVLVINRDMGINSVRELADYMKANPNKIMYGSSGQGSTHVVLAELFNLTAGVQSLHVPYKGSGPTQVDIISGQIHITFDSVPGTLQNIRAGLFKALAVTSRERSPELPDVPTMIEAGFPEVEMEQMYGLYAPAGTPKEILNTLNAAVRQGRNDPDFTRRMESLGGRIGNLSIDDFAEFNAAEYKRYGDIIDRADVRSK